jgi:radical SAM superfamily enzyme YgiQ (UPF0313 family)
MPNPHHGLAWIAGSLKRQGHQVSCHVLRSPEDAQALAVVVGRTQPDCIGISLVTHQRKNLDSIVTLCRRQYQGLVIVGGIHATLAPQDTLACEGVDAVCVGEGEIPLLRLGECLAAGENPRGMDGFLWRGAPPGRPPGSLRFASDLAGLARPDYSIFDMPSILRHGPLSGYFPILISRGCPYECTYCCNKAIRSVYASGRGYFRMLPSEAAVELLEEVVQRHRPGGFNFGDDLLVCNRNWFGDFSALYRRRIGLPYVCNGRVERLQDERIIAMLKESGCRQLSFGLESGDEPLRRTLLKRPYTDEQVLRCAALLHEAGIPFSTYNIVGFPGETPAQMERTYDLNRRIRPTSGMVFYFYPYPGTELYDLCEREGLLDPPELDKPDGFMERPVLRYPAGVQAAVRRAYRKLFLYFKTRKAARLFRVDSPAFDSALHRLMLLAPGVFQTLGKGRYVPSFLRDRAAARSGGE